MGQQQLILLVLGTVIVGAAIVVGIRAFTENSVKSNSDALIHDAVRVATDLQAWKQKATPFGGQSDNPAGCKAAVDCFNGATWLALGYSDGGSGIYENVNGRFGLFNAESGMVIVGCNETTQNGIVVMVNGLTDATIKVEEVVLGGIGGDCFAEA